MAAVLVDDQLVMDSEPTLAAVEDEVVAAVLDASLEVAPLSSDDLELGLPALEALAPVVATESPGATTAEGESSSSALPSFSKRARALLKRVWWLSVRVTDLRATRARSSSFLDSEAKRCGVAAADVGEVGDKSRLMRSGRLGGAEEDCESVDDASWRWNLLAI